MDVITWSWSKKEEEQFEEIMPYMKPEANTIIEEGIVYWVLTNKFVLTRSWHSIKFHVEERREYAQEKTMRNEWGIGFLVVLETLTIKFSCVGWSIRCSQ